MDFITSLDGYGAAEGWPGWWGLQGPEYLAWLGKQPEAGYTVLMGANTYRLMSGFAAEGEGPARQLRTRRESDAAVVTVKISEGPEPRCRATTVRTGRVGALVDQRRAPTALRPYG